MVYPYEGKLAEVMKLVKASRLGEALSVAQAWRDGDAGDVRRPREGGIGGRAVAALPF